MTRPIFARGVIAALFALALLFASQAQAGVDPAIVPLFHWRARAVNINGEVPAADKSFTYRNGRGGDVATSKGDAWSDWVAYNLQLATIENSPNSYPAQYMKGWPMVTKFQIGGIVDRTVVEFEAKFDDTGVVKKMRGELFGGSLGMLVWRETDEAKTPGIATMAEWDQRYWDVLAKVQVPEEHRPKHIFIVDRYIGGDSDYLAWEGGLRNLSKAGFNGLMINPDKRLRDMMLSHGVSKTAWAVYNPPGYAFDYEEGITPASIQDWADKLAKPFLDVGYAPTDMRTYAMSDEPGWYYPGQFKALQASDEGMQRFRDYLRDQGMTPELLGKHAWSEVQPLGRSKAVDLPSKRLFYWTMRFFAWDSSRHFANSTAALEQAFYPGLPIFTNWNFFSGRLYVPGPVANNSAKQDPDAAMGGHDWLEFGRMRGGTMLWTEDWFSDNQAYQWSFYNAKLRTAAEKGGVTFGGYVIPRTAGQREDGIVQKIMSIVGHGGKGVKYFVFGPEYNFPSNCYSENIKVLPKMAEAHAMIGRAEDLFWPGVTPPRRVAILHPRSAEMWDAKDVALPDVVYDATNTNLNARTTDYFAEIFNIFTALQHANIPTDFVEEQDMNIDGLDGYDVLYVTEPNIPTEDMQGLAAWVKQGGHVVLVTGAGTFDRYDERDTTLGDALGIVESPRDRLLIGNVNSLPVVGDVQIPASAEHAAESLRVYGAVAAAKSADATVIATFKDGSPAAFQKRVGDGKVTFFNFLPGISYVRSTNARKDGLPVGWSIRLRDLIVKPVVDEGVQLPVVVSEPMIETPVLVSDAGMAVTLLNWTGEKRGRVTLHLRTPFKVTSVESLDHGKIEFERVADGVKVTLDVDAVDVLKVKP